MTADVRAYLCNYESVTVWHLRDLCSGKRKIIKCDEVKVIILPQYEGLTIDDILEFAAEYDDGAVL